MEKDLELPPAHVASTVKYLTKTCKLQKKYDVLTCNSAAVSDMAFIRNECPVRVNEKTLTKEYPRVTKRNIE